MSRNVLPLLAVGQEAATIIVQVTERGIEVRTDPENMPAFAILGLMDLAADVVRRQTAFVRQAAREGDLP